MKESESSGWNGRRLKIDLTTRRIAIEELPPSYLKNWIGGRGFNIEVLSREAPANLDPFDPEAPICFAAGPLVGTLAPCSGWINVAARSPLTSPCTYGCEDMGGHWGAELKFAGYDQVVIRGMASKPVFLWIHDHEVEVREAEDLWGMDTRRCTLAIQERVDEREAKVLCIGPAGEKRVRFATLVNTFSWKGGRLGLGAVMGAKNLKAIAVRGKGFVGVDDPKAFASVCRGLYEAISQDPYARRLGEDGTLFPLDFEGLGFFENQDTSIEEGRLNLQDYRRQFFQFHDACFSCPIHCGRYSYIQGGDGDDFHFGGFHLEALLNLGPRIGVHNWEAALRMTHLCLLYGLDSVSMGAMMSWLADVNGFRGRGEVAFTRGDSGTALRVIEGTAWRRNEFTEMLGEGIQRASQGLAEVGSDALPVVKGVEEPSFDPRVRRGAAFSFSLSPRGGYLDLLGCWEIPAIAEYYRWTLEQALGRKLIFPLRPEDEVGLVTDMENREVVASLAGVCPLIVARVYTLTTFDLSSALKGLTGVPIEEDGLLNNAERVIGLERLYRGADGIERGVDSLPQCYFGREVTAGRWKGGRLEEEEWNNSLSQYYQMRGWNEDTGLPPKDLLRQSELENGSKKNASA